MRIDSNITSRQFFEELYVLVFFNDFFSSLFACYFASFEKESLICTAAAQEAFWDAVVPNIISGIKLPPKNIARSQHTHTEDSHLHLPLPL